ncbi:hypothetical protein N7509_002111 [Penicillium cosmopolitanum]|uniref:DNA repair protein rhp7 treble clef domain-containing protein n=1 Tax=Penicillium cosmopolitanum TaxID=1131564 RepID=A0A9W9W8D5_9EURO|nr:uncharacterized protein N7509_002111 [Penicillium cosmopolitanum]KAJ5408228.1 hypothetical protein N7509_002111 [Penicillium cosmopolitanum]
MTGRQMGVRVSNNISAAQIRDDYDRRVTEAARQANEETTTATAENQDPEFEPEPEPESPEDKAKKRKRQQAIERIKKTKEFSRRKARRTGEPDDDDDDWLANQIADEKARPAPGQLENCEICGKRFTVTPYSKAGPEGGLLCADCSKNQAKGDGKKAPPKKRAAGPGRRQNQSKLLDGLTAHGAQSLLEMCIKKVAENIEDVEEFGDLPPPVMHRLSQILSRRRAVTSRILNLFLRRNHRELNIYDCAHLHTDDYHRILALMPDLTKLNLRFVTPMKDHIFEYMIENNKSIRDLHLDSPNLVTDDCWREVFVKMGPRLQSLKLWNLDAAFDDKTAEVMCENCTGLERLKLKYIAKIGDGALKGIASLKTLKHLSLCFMQETEPEPLLHVISSIGPNLRSLSLEDFKNADDPLIQSIHDNCHSLTKLRFAKNDLCTDKALASLFQNWSNPPLTYVDLHRVRDVDMSNPAGPPEPVGLASDGFIALMEHSGSRIQSLNVSSCRHISREAYETVFAENKQYPHLRHLDISFNGPVDDYIAQCILRCCPALTKFVVFACFKIRELKVNKGVAVIGTIGAKLTVEGIVQAETM